MWPLYEELDWELTPVGPCRPGATRWSTRSTSLLGMQFPVTLFWGPEFVLIYNAAHVRAHRRQAPTGVRASRAPRVPRGVGADRADDAACVRGARRELGRRPVRAVVSPRPRPRGLLHVLYSPVRGREDVIEGVLDIAVETTLQVASRRRLETLSRLRDALDAAGHADQVPELAVSALMADPAGLCVGRDRSRRRAGARSTRRASSWATSASGR